MFSSTKIIAALCLLIGLTVVPVAEAQLTGFFGSSSAYKGPLDIVGGATFCGGVRACSQAKAAAGAALLNVCYDLAGVDQTCVDMVSNSAGQLVVTTVGGFSCGVVTCTAKIIYDGSGAGNNMTQTTVASRATFTLNCLNGTLPCLTASGSAIYTATISSTATPQSASLVEERVSGGDTAVIGFTTNQGFGFGNVANMAAIFTSGRYQQAAADGAFHSVQYISSSGTGTLNVDGTSGSGSVASASTGATLALFALSNATDLLTGSIAEAIFYASTALNSTQYGNLCHNELVYFGTSGSC